VATIHLVRVEEPNNERFRRRGGLAWHRDFRLLWAGDTISQFGSQVSVLVLPLVAVLYLHATTFEVGVLSAMESVAFLLIGLPAGAWCDRVRRRPVMIAGDLVRCALLASIPIAAALGNLTLSQLFAVALLHGIATVFFDIAYQSYLPALVTRRDLMEGNAKLQASQSVAQVAGPTLGGVLVEVFTSPFALVADAVSFLGSALCVAVIRRPEPAPERPVHGHFVEEIGEGLSFVLRHPILRMIAGTTGTSNLFSSAFGAVVVVFLVRTVHLSAGVIGLLMSAGSIGGVLGALTASAIARRIGQARTIWLSILTTAPFGLLIPLTGPGGRLAFYASGLLAVSFGIVVYNVAQVSFRQALCPPRLLGRMNATMRFLVWGTMPFGALLGGALGTWIGLRPTLWISQIGEVLAAGWVIVSPLRSPLRLPTYDPEDLQGPTEPS
jgi:MFS family permease